jgi:hypothetical protein
MSPDVAAVSRCAHAARIRHQFGRGSASDMATRGGAGGRALLDRKVPPCGKRHAPRAVSHVARGSAKTEKKNRKFLRATGDGGKRSTIESERNSPNARVRTMRSSPTTDVSRVRALSQPRSAGGDAPRPSPESAVRTTNSTPDWRRSGRKAELAVRRELRARVRGMRRGPCHCEPQRAMFPPDPLPSINTGGYNAVRRAHHAAGVSA